MGLLFLLMAAFTMMPPAALPGVMNNTDLHYGDMGGLQLPPATTLGEGLQLCAAFCSNHTSPIVCEAWVFVSKQSGDGGPRCAIKPAGPCTTVPKVGCYVGFRPGHCDNPPSPPSPHPPHPSPPPPPHPQPPHPPPPPPPPSRAEMTPIFHVSPAQCHGGWTNDPSGPFEYNGVHHLFYQVRG